jgi:hypothetical protein
MIRVSWKTIRHADTGQALNKLASHEEIPGKLAHRAGKLITVLDGVMKKIQDTLKDNVKPYLKKNEQGEAIVPEDGKVEFESPAQRDAWVKELDRISAETFEEINLKPLPYSEIVKLKGFSGFDLVALEPFMDGVPEAEAL